MIDIYLELSTILKSREELDGEQFEQFENELYIVKERIWLLYSSYHMAPMGKNDS